MGVTCVFKSASDEQLLLLRRDPGLVSFFFGDEDEPAPASFWERLFKRRRAVPAAILEQADCNPEESLDYLLEHFGVLWAFTRDVVDENQGFLIWIE
jgi:hypothetical protein